MGTSQSFKIKSSPNWSKAKRAMTHLSTPGNMTEANATRFLGHFGRAAGESRTFGRAGSATASNFIAFIGHVRNLGWEDVIRQVEPDTDLQALTAEEFLELLLKLCCDNDSDLDDQAANVAFEKLEAEIQGNLNTAQEIGELIENATEEQVLEWVGDFYVDYIMEVFNELYYTHLDERGVIPEDVMDGLRDYVMTSVNELLLERPDDLNIFSEEGRDFVNGLLDDLNEQWEQSLE